MPYLTYIIILPHYFYGFYVCSVIGCGKPFMENGSERNVSPSLISTITSNINFSITDAFNLSNSVARELIFNFLPTNLSTFLIFILFRLD